jgi:hypothetical protein
VLAAVLVLLLLGRSIGYNLDRYDTSKYDISKWAPKGQPVQIRSKVNYDPNLSDPFFESNEWSYPWGVHKNKDGSFEDMTSDKKPKREPPRIKHTAKCLASFPTKHWSTLCDAKLLAEDKLQLYIRSDGESSNLRIVVQNGMFRSQYWTIYKAGPDDQTWTTKRQNLTLDKESYRKGDEIKGRIDFECAEGTTNPKAVEYYVKNPRTMKINGVFKTIVK